MLVEMYLTVIYFQTQLNAKARRWAKTMAARNSLFHSGTKGYGENLYASWGTQVTGRHPVDSFYKEIKYYNYNAPGFSKKTGQLQQHLFRILIHFYHGVSGHFTQVVWKSSRAMGVGVAQGSNGYTYVAVLYYPPGNYQGQFRANVPRPRY